MKNLQEKKLHGQPDFPFAVYPGRLPEFGTGYPMHSHEELELVCVQEGSGILTVRAERIRIRAGDLVVIPSHTVHSFEQLDREEMRYHTILFRLSLLEENPGIRKYTAALRNLGEAKLWILPKGEALNGYLMPSVTELLQYRCHRDDGFELMVCSHLYRILYILYRESGDPAAAEARKQANYEKRKELLEYLQEHYAQPMSLTQAAERIGFSRSHFMRLFRQWTGTSFNQYVKQLRLDTAAEQLRTTGKRVGEIAQETGFQNISYFTRAFADKYHMPPSDYRRIWQKKKEM